MRAFARRVGASALVAFSIQLGAAATAGGQEPSGFTNPVVPGSYPDPSVLKVGDEYWASATSGPWIPAFPLLRSRDLVNWRMVGAVFPRPPRWTRDKYWSPDLARIGDRYLVYYAALSRRGRFCVGVAVASSPQGRYRDRGPLVCQRNGSIDPSPVRDETGQLHLLWKENGNARGVPTPIWAQPLSPDGTALAGQPRELFRNDAAWEGDLVEGPAAVRRGSFFYIFYSGNSCCTPRCRYAVGVARAPTLLGPWEKRATNPILRGNGVWSCPGHGGVAEGPDGRAFYLYHAYGPGLSWILGRQLLLDEIRWGADGWPTIGDGTPSLRAPGPLGAVQAPRPQAFVDDFRSSRLAPGWEWEQPARPRIRLERAGGGRLLLASGGRLLLARGSRKGASPVRGVLTRRPASLDLTATATVVLRGLHEQANAGLASYYDQDNAVGVAVGPRSAIVWQRVRGRQRVIGRARAPRSRAVVLRMAAEGGRVRFALSADGRRWRAIGRGRDLRFLKGLRVALTAGGRRAAGRFERATLSPDGSL